MSLLDTVFNFFSSNTHEDAPEGVCPNCWGTQEYDNQIREILKDKQIDINNKAQWQEHAFIQDFVVNNINGIKLKSSVHGLQCPTCLRTKPSG